MSKMKDLYTDIAYLKEQDPLKLSEIAMQYMDDPQYNKSEKVMFAQFFFSQIYQKLEGEQ